MTPLADDVFVITGFPRHAINVYVIGDVLIDSATRFDGGRILSRLRGRTIRAHVLTHAHPDHLGSSHRICATLSVPLWCGAEDADAAEDPKLMLRRLPRHWINRSIAPLICGAGHPVARRLRDGDEVGRFRAIATPGHSAGHMSFWREADRTLILGDVLASMNPVLGFRGLREPPAFFSADPAVNRRSARKIAELEPALVCFGHGPPIRDPRGFTEFIGRLSDP